MSEYSNLLLILLMFQIKTHMAMSLKNTPKKNQK